MSTSVSKSVWEGRIPLAISIDESEAQHFGTNNTPSPIFIEVPRTSYLTLLTEEVRDLYKAVGIAVPESTAEIWFEYQGKPLKWHYPLGLLYDILCISDPSYQQVDSVKAIPWNINVHFRNYPVAHLFRDQSAVTAQDFFMSMIKEADFLRYGSTKRVMNLSKSDQTQLWNSLCSNDYESFWKVNQRLIPLDDQVVRHIPLRLYLPDDCPVIQDRVSPRNEEGEELTIQQIIQQLLPTLDTSDSKAVCHGVVVPLDTPIVWASRNLAYPDNFLHITLY
ncbi:autophagy protein Apg5-domain-containing protein [Umbelopsis sp. PMI_123]|nr:autophagy protein Apg5-domain-containing protein [Umbelopsis sp. PMI_123]